MSSSLDETGSPTRLSSVRRPELDGPALPRFALPPITANNELYYANLSKFATGIEPGSRVKQGQLIGFSGAANGVNHLHVAL